MSVFTYYAAWFNMGILLIDFNVFFDLLLYFKTDCANILVIIEQWDGYLAIFTFETVGNFCLSFCKWILEWFVFVSHFQVNKVVWTLVR